MQRTFADRPEIQIVGVFEEAFSAKAPGRQKFNDMLVQIEKGQAQGIIAWAPDRLARNSIDGGRVVYLLDRGIIRDLKFSTYTFENNSQGKFMLQIMFGQSKYYSDALSENVKRGNKTKIEKGWRPNSAPLGYLNEPETKTIVPDPIHFPLIRRMFDLLLSGAHTPRQIATIAQNDWGFRTPKRKRIGGVPLAMSSVYKIFGNPFYAGIILWGGQAYPGKHTPVVSLEEFKAARKILEKPGRPRAKRYDFPFRGFIRCASCGMAVTAEHKQNRYGTRYIYYHCAKRAFGHRCTERSIEATELHRQFAQYLRSIELSPAVSRWVLKQIRKVDENANAVRLARIRSLKNGCGAVQEQLNELTGLRLRNLVTDTEFTDRRQALQTELIELQTKLRLDTSQHSLLEPLQRVISFGSRAVEWFSQGDCALKKRIIASTTSNLLLRSQELLFEAAKPLTLASKLSLHPRLLGAIEDGRISNNRQQRAAKKFIEEVRAVLTSDEGRLFVENITAIIKDCEAEFPGLVA